jgi:hypothetical protein
MTLNHGKTGKQLMQEEDQSNDINFRLQQQVLWKK